jgi:hypothetical protein
MKTNTLSNRTLRQMLNLHLLNHCTDCGEQRHKVYFENLPEKMKKEVFEFKDESCFLYCDKCQEYSIIISI